MFKIIWSEKVAIRYTRWLSKKLGRYISYEAVRVHVCSAPVYRAVSKYSISEIASK